MRSLYPAFSHRKIVAVATAIEDLFDLSRVQSPYKSEHFESATSSNESLAIQLIQFFDSVEQETGDSIGAPDFWFLGWRAAVGKNFNYLVEVDLKGVPVNRTGRRRMRRIARRLRAFFENMRLHGECTGVRDLGLNL